MSNKSYNKINFYKNNIYKINKFKNIIYKKSEEKRYKNKNLYVNRRKQIYKTNNFINSQNYIKTGAVKSKVDSFVKIFLTIKYFILFVISGFLGFLLLNILSSIGIVSNNFIEYNGGLFLFNKVFLFYSIYLVIVFLYFSYYKKNDDIKGFEYKLLHKNIFETDRKMYYFYFLLSTIGILLFVQFGMLNYFFVLEYILGLIFIYLYTVFQVFFMFSLDYILYLKKPVVFENIFSMLDNNLTRKIFVKHGI